MVVTNPTGPVVDLSAPDVGDLTGITSADGSVTIVNPGGPIPDLSTTQVGAVVPTAASGATPLPGVSAEAARADHKHNLEVAIADQSVGQGPAHSLDFIGVGVVAAVAGQVGVIRIDGAAAGNAPAFDVAPDNVAAPGASATAARSDHIHAAPAGVPVTVGAANAEGTANTFARSDHVHEHFPGAAPVQAYEHNEESNTTGKAGGGWSDIAGMSLTVGTAGVYAVAFNGAMDIPPNHTFNLRIAVNGVAWVGTVRTLITAAANIEWVASIMVVIPGLVATDTVAAQWIRGAGAGTGQCDDRSISIVEILQ